MKVMFVDAVSPRSDGVRVRPTGVTVGKIYMVAEVLDNTQQYSIINDKNKIGRYPQFRFIVVDPTPVKELRDGFNDLTLGMRMRIKELESLLEKKS